MSTPRPKLPSSLGSGERVVSGSSARNPISLRLYKALGSSFQDPASREALETLSAFYAPTEPLHHITHKTPNHDEDEMTSDEEEDKPEELSRELYLQHWTERSHQAGVVDSSIAEHARKNFRRDTELQLAESSAKFLKAFGQVDEKLDTLQEHMDEMRARCDEAQLKLQQTNEACKHLLEKASSLRSQRQLTVARQNLVSQFLARYTLTDAEVEAITSHDVPVGKQFFAAMDRAERIREDCHVLLSGDEGQTTAGLDIMAQTATYLEQAYVKVQRWCSFEFRQLAKESHLEVSPIMRDAIRRLRQRPEILTGALSDLAAIRQSTILGAFTTALTRGGPSGYPRPIELHAHDPTRYVGDMLAWVHQAMATEREFLDSLFGSPTAQKRMVGSVWLDKDGQESEEAGWVRELMDRDLEKICTPLRVRVQQTIKSQEGSITAYKITNLLQFYFLTMQRTIGEDVLLSQTLKALTEVSKQVFMDTIAAQGRSLLRYIDPPDADLSPPFALRDVSQVLREIMSMYNSSLLEDETPSSTNIPVEQEDFTRILDAAIDPALEMCSRMAEMKRDGPIWDKEIFLVNCTAYLQNVFQPFKFATSRVEVLDQKINAHISVLVGEHYTRLLSDSGLAPIVKTIESKDKDTPLSRLPESSSSAISTALTTFDNFLSSLDVQTSPQLALLSSPRYSSRVHRAALQKIGEAYRVVSDAVRNPANKYEFVSTVLGSKRPFGQMDVLWQVLGVDEQEKFL